VLELAGISTNYGVVAMLRDVSLAVGPNEIVCLLGPNGAGKTTTFRTVAGLIPLVAGRISLLGRDLASMRTEGLARLGIGFVPEGRRLFPELTVLENIRLGFDAAGRGGSFPERLDAMAALFPQLKGRMRQNAGTLSGGEQAMVALARALIAEPKLLVMDEPSLGLSPKLIDEYFETVLSINGRGTSVLLIEQNAEAALSIGHRGYLLVKGRIAAQGAARDLLDNDVVRKLYF
jgi:branched-chain amino acid transport system ATP-binding protein